MSRARVLLGLAGLLAGCASRSPARSIDAVEDLLAERTGERVDWQAGEREDRAIAGLVRARLEDGLTLADAVQIGLVNNRDLQATFEALGIAQADLVQAGLLRNPAFDVHLRVFGGAVFPEAAFIQNLLDAFLIPARKKIARAQLEAAKLHVAAAVLALRAEIKRTFLDLQTGTERLARQRSIAEAAEIAAELADLQLGGGTTNAFDHAALQAAAQRRKLEVVRAETELAGHREALNRLLGLWGVDVGWALQGALPGLPDERLPLNRLEAVAMRQRLDISASRAQLEGMARAVALARGARFTRVDLGATLERDLDGAFSVGPVIEFELPIFDWGQGELTRLRAQLRQAQRRLEAQAIDARAEVRLARTQLVNAERMVRYYRDVVLPQQERFVGLAQTHYDAMQISVYDLLRAKQEQLDAHRELLTALRDYWRARVDLELAVGGRLDPVLNHHEN